MPNQLAGLLSPDSMQATPRQNKLLGLLADAVGSADQFARKPFGYDNPPVGLLSDAIGVPGLQRTLDRMSYGEPLTTGKGQATQLRPDTVDALGFVPASPKTALSMAGGLLGHAPAIDHAAIVWHGSPHKFDAFDASKIGTGEGAQAYGHGLYLAQSPEVAKGYQQALSTYQTTIDGQPLTPNHPQFGAAMSIAAQGYKKALADAENALASGFIDPIYGAQQIADIKALSGAKIKQAQGGALYKVDLPDDAIARMLDWDKPLSQQAPGVRAALQKIPFETGGGVDWLGRDILDMAQSHAASNAAGQYVAGGGSPSLGSDLLRQQGISGIRYLDGGSRGTGTGTSNFVVFPGNEGLLKILERNGQPVKKVAK